MLYLIKDSIGFLPVLPEDVSSSEDKSNVNTSQSFCLLEWVYCGSKKAFYYFNIAWKLVSSKCEGQTSGKVTTALHRSAADITILSSACLLTWCPDLTCAAITSSGSIRRPLECHWCLGIFIYPNEGHESDLAWQAVFIDSTENARKRFLVVAL